MATHHMNRATFGSHCLVFWRLVNRRLRLVGSAIHTLLVVGCLTSDAHAQAQSRRSSTVPSVFGTTVTAATPQTTRIFGWLDPRLGHPDASD